MIESRVSKPGVKWTALSSYAAGVTSILANIFLIALYTLQGNRAVEAAYFGTANDLVGSLEIRHLHLVSATQHVAGERDVCLDHLLDPARYRRPLGVHVPPLPHRKVAGQALEVVRVADGDLCRGGSNFGGVLARSERRGGSDP